VESFTKPVLAEEDIQVKENLLKTASFSLEVVANGAGEIRERVVDRQGSAEMVLKSTSTALKCWGGGLRPG